MKLQSMWSPCRTPDRMAAALVHLLPSIGLSIITGMLRIAFCLMASSWRSRTEAAMRTIHSKSDVREDMHLAIAQVSRSMLRLLGSRDALQLKKTMSFTCQKLVF